jgi:hypothetical protein
MAALSFFAGLTLTVRSVIVLYVLLLSLSQP